MKAFNLFDNEVTIYVGRTIEIESIYKSMCRHSDKVNRNTAFWVGLHPTFEDKPRFNYLMATYGLYVDHERNEFCVIKSDTAMAYIIDEFDYRR